MVKGGDMGGFGGGEAASSSTRGSGWAPVGRPLPGSAELPRAARRVLRRRRSRAWGAAKGGGTLAVMECGAPMREEHVAVCVRELQRGTDRAVLRRLVKVVAAVLRPFERVRASAVAAVHASCRLNRRCHSKITKVLALGRALPGSDGGVVLLRLLFHLPHPTPAQRVRLALLSQRPAC